MLMGIQFGSAERAPQENNTLKIIRFVAPAAYNNAIVLSYNFYISSISSIHELSFERKHACDGRRFIDFSKELISY
jgi:hypothetical protein